MGRPVGIWIASAYLLAFGLLVLSLLYLVVQSGGGIGFILCGLLLGSATVVVALSGAILLLAQRRWAVPPIGLLAMWQAWIAYLSAQASAFVDQEGSTPAVDAGAISYLPLVLLSATIGALLYSGWLWQRGVLR